MTPYTAVVYVHGMGSQRRYEETSRLVDTVERYVRMIRATPAGRENVGQLLGITAELEPSRVCGDDVGFISVHDEGNPRVPSPGSDYRFYEAYWAPLAAGATTWRSVVGWMVRQVGAPIRSLWSGWRSRTRLRRALLHERWARVARVVEAPTAADRSDLLLLLEQFDAPPARRAFPKDRHRDFRAFAVSQAAPVQQVRIGKLVDAWRRAHLSKEWLNLFLVLTVLATLAMAVLALFAAVAWALNAAGVPIVGSALQSLHMSVDDAGWKMVAAIVTALLSATGVLRFLSDYVGDVQLWSTYEETDVKSAKRRAILDRAVMALSHVLRDPACARVAVVAHSLGTSVAFDALLELGRHNRAVNPADPMGAIWNPTDRSLPIHRIEYFVTLASPIDKIYYFFEDYQGRLYRYNQTVEAVRGDVGTPPFTGPPESNPHRFIRWYNVWDEADIISGSLESPSHPLWADVGIDNIEMSALSFPNPAAAHEAYFDHRGVAALLYEVIFQQVPPGSVVPPQPTPPFPGGLVGHQRVTRVWQALAVATPWLVLIALVISWVSGAGTLRTLAQRVAGAAVALLVLGILAFGLGRQRAPLQP